jgi:hypothetical protein
MYTFYIIENAQEFSSILLQCDEAVNCLVHDYNKHKISNCIKSKVRFWPNSALPWKLLKMQIYDI